MCCTSNLNLGPLRKAVGEAERPSIKMIFHEHYLTPQHKRFYSSCSATNKVCCNFQDLHFSEQPKPCHNGLIIYLKLNGRFNVKYCW